MLLLDKSVFFADDQEKAILRNQIGLRNGILSNWNATEKCVCAIKGEYCFFLKANLARWMNDAFMRKFTEMHIQGLNYDDLDEKFIDYIRELYLSIGSANTGDRSSDSSFEKLDIIIDEENFTKIIKFVNKKGELAIQCIMSKPAWDYFISVLESIVFRVRID